MDEMTHTPGPWFWPISNALASHPSKDPDSEWYLVAGFDAGHTPSPANARLIAAAPELLEALEALPFEMLPYSQWAEEIKMARAAIAKARGQSWTR